MSSTPNVAGDSRRLISLPTVAEILGVSRRHVERLRKLRAIPEPIKLGSSIRWDHEVILRWIDSGCPHQSDSGETFHV